MEDCLVKLEAKDREEGKNPRQLRSEGLLPVTVYGKDVNVNAVINTHEFKLAYAKNKNAKYEIAYNKKSYSVVAKNVQINYATNEIQSAEFAVV